MEERWETLKWVNSYIRENQERWEFEKLERSENLRMRLMCDMDTAWKKHGSAKWTQIIGNNLMCCQFNRERAPATSRPFESDGWWLVGWSSAGLSSFRSSSERSRTSTHTTGAQVDKLWWTDCSWLSSLDGLVQLYWEEGVGNSLCVSSDQHWGLESWFIEETPESWFREETVRRGPGICILRETGEVTRDMHLPLSTEPSD